MRTRTAGFGMITLITIAACASKPSSTTTTSSVDGQIAAGSFAVAPTGVDAINEKGARTHVAVAPDGSFRITLEKGHSYTLVVVGPRGEEPVVFPRNAGKLDRSFRVSTGAAITHLGVVRHLERAPAEGFMMTRSATGGQCVDGVVAGTTRACADDDAKATCEKGESSDADGECENGKDAKTGAPCTDNDNDGEAADGTKPMAVPEHNPPDDVSGCNEGDDGEEDDD